MQVNVSPAPVSRGILALILAAAFAARLGVRVAFGEEYFWTNGYAFYYKMARNLIGGEGFCLGAICAWTTPLYPMFLALTTLAGKHYLAVVIPQAMMGAGTALCAFLIARALFNPSAAIAACAGVAFYPYYVIHDTALQESGMVTFWTALSVYLLIKAGRSDGKAACLFAGLALGALTLTRASAAPTAIIGVIWIGYYGVGAWKQRLRKASIVLLAVCMTVIPWLVRNYRLTGAPVLSSQTGRALWIGNNPDTFWSYPAGSIDLSEAKAQRALPLEERAELERLSKNEVQTSSWYARKALAFIKEHPSLVFERAFRKLQAGFSWTFNPVRQPLVQAIYFVTYCPVAMLGIVGMYLARRRREVVLVGMLYLAFICVTVIFWAHTSHRSYLDVYFIIFAASVIERAWRSQQRRRVEA